MFDAEQIELANGLKLVTIKKDTNIASIQAGIKVGSLYEKEMEKGISHFIEHMLFKGTELQNNEELNRSLEERGGEYNAYTDYNCTVYSMTALIEETEECMKLMSEMLMRSTFQEDELEKERGVILSEIRTSKDDLEDLSFRRVNEAAFDKGPLKYDTIGEEKTVKSFTKKQIVEFYRKYYVPNNCIITVVSNMEHDIAQKLVMKYFDEWKWQELKEHKFYMEKNKNIKKITYKKDIEQCTIIYLFTFYDLTKEQELSLKILNHKFGESANSILFRELREDRGLAYDVYTHLDLTSYVKTLYIYTAVGEESLEEAMEVIDDCIKRMKNEDIVFDDGTVNLMKKVLKTAIASTLEDSTDLGNYVLHQVIDNEDIYQFYTDMENMEKIKKEDIYNTARLIFNEPTIHILLAEK